MAKTIGRTSGSAFSGAMRISQPNAPTIVPPPPPGPVITTTSLPGSLVGHAYSFQLTASGGTPPYAWSRVSATPNTGNWLSVPSSGLMGGTPGTAEIETVTVQVLDANSLAATATFSFPVTVPSGTTVTEGVVFAVSGSGFGTKANAYQNPYTAPLVWDDCSHGQPLSARWDVTYPYANPNPADNMAYRAAGFHGVRSPFLRKTGFVGGICNGGAGNTGSGVISTSLNKYHTRPMNPGSGTTGGTAPFMMTCRWYEQKDALSFQGVSDVKDGNYKFADYGIDFYQPSAHMYTSGNVGSNQPGGVTPPNLLARAAVNNLEWVPQLLLMSESGGAGINNFGQNYLNRTIVGQWVEIEQFYWAVPLGDTSGRWRIHTNNLGQPQGVEYDVFTGLVHGGSTLTISRSLDCSPGTRRLQVIGGYNRDYPGPNQGRYMCGIYIDFGEGWFYLTNNATWGSETIREIQPYVDWADTLVHLTCNGGAHASGTTVHLHFRMAPWKGSGHQYKGALTLT